LDERVSSSQKAPPRITQRTRFYLVLLYSTLANTMFMGARVNVPLLALDRDASTFTVGVLMGLFSFLPAILAVHTGRWIDRVGLGIPMIICGAIMTACLLILFFFPVLAVLFPAIAVFGLAYIGFNLAVNAAVGAIGKPEDRTANFSWLSLTGGVANIAGPVCAGYLIDAIGHAATFAVLAVLPALVTAMIVVFRYTRPPRPPAVRSVENAKVLDLMREPKLIGPLVVGALVAVAYDVYSFLVPVYGSNIGLSATQIGNILGAFGVSVFLVRIAVPFLSKVFTPWQLVIASQFLAAAVFLVFPFASAVTFLVVLSLIYGLTFGVLQPVVTALLFNAAPPGRAGEAMGLRATLQNSMHAVMPAFFGVIGALLGTLPVFWCVAALVAGAGWVSKARWSKA
jgi:MFS family permease